MGMYLRGLQRTSSTHHVSVFTLWSRRWRWWSWPTGCLRRGQGNSPTRRLLPPNRWKEGGGRKKKTNMDWWTIWSLRVFLQWEKKDRESSSLVERRSFSLILVQKIQSSFQIKFWACLHRQPYAKLILIHCEGNQDVFKSTMVQDVEWPLQEVKGQ